MKHKAEMLTLAGIKQFSIDFFPQRMRPSYLSTENGRTCSFRIGQKSAYSRAHTLFYNYILFF